MQGIFYIDTAKIQNQLELIGNNLRILECKKKPSWIKKLISNQAIGWKQIRKKKLPYLIKDVCELPCKK